MKGLVVGAKRGTTEEGNNWFPEAEGELVFTLVFEEDNKKRVPEMHRGLRSNTVANYLVSSIVMLTDEEKMNAMTCSELHQFACCSKYKVCSY